SNSTLIRSDFAKCYLYRGNETDLEIGDIGTVVFVYKQQKGYEVEFMTLTGETVAVVSVLPSQVRTIRDPQ
ncbi:MAG: DUF4926 domain-containing protein, partial [Pseudanabaena sp. ELA748]